MGPRFAQAPQTRDPLAFLKRALNKAGAAPLSSTQEQQLNTLISAFQSTVQSTPPDPALQAARDNYDNAVLSGSAAGATAAADNLAGVLATHQRASLEAEAGFQVQAYAVLQADQVAALEKSVGKGGLVRLLGSLTGRFGFRGFNAPRPTSN